MFLSSVELLSKFNNGLTFEFCEKCLSRLKLLQIFSYLAK